MGRAAGCGALGKKQAVSYSTVMWIFRGSIAHRTFRSADLYGMISHGIRPNFGDLVSRHNVYCNEKIKAVLCYKHNVL